MQGPKGLLCTHSGPLRRSETTACFFRPARMVAPASVFSLFSSSFHKLSAEEEWVFGGQGNPSFCSFRWGPNNLHPTFPQMGFQHLTFPRGSPSQSVMLGCAAPPPMASASNMPAGTGWWAEARGGHLDSGLLRGCVWMRHHGLSMRHSLAFAQHTSALSPLPPVPPRPACPRLTCCATRECPVCFPPKTYA